MELKLVLFIALVAGSQAGPIQEVTIGNRCASTCTGSNKFDYKPGTTYEFKYENEIRTALQGAAQDHAGLSLSATVNLDFVTECEAVMRLSNVVVKEHDPETSRMKIVSAELKTLLEKDPVGFSFQDGKVEKICLAEIQDVKVLNIKRGILSMFQNNMDDITREQNVKESDVAGTCDTEYTSADKGWYNVVVKKSKNILSCTDRNDAKTALQGIPYGSQSTIQSLPLIKSTHTCEQEMVKETGRLVSANCKEQHLFAPFARENSGAVTHSTQDLTFVKHSQINAKPVSLKKSTNLHYDHSVDDKLTNPMEQLEAELNSVCTITKNGVTEDTPRLFTSLIHTLKRMGASEIATVYQNIAKKQICKDNNDRVRKFFLDAIPMTGTPASLKMLTQLLIEKEVTGVEAEMWLTSLAFIQNPTVEMLAEVKKLLTIDSNEEKAMLSVSSLVNSLCRNNPDCQNYIEVRKIVSLLENKIAPSCKVTTKTMQKTLIALRALGNAGFGMSAIPTLQKCIMQSSNPIEIRLSAIEAFRRIPCSADKSVVMSVFTSTDEDSETRIAAYKTLMECPSTTVLRKIKVMLEREEINQVGSYVWSHLTNLMETSDPHKQTIRSILQDEALKKEFDMDKRKFSRNYEGSFMIEKLNTGATAEGDLIWSSKSFIPRSAMVNLTVDLFGNAINLFEIGGRVEGLEYFFEKYFGPNGYFSENDVQEAVDETAVSTIKGDKANRINKRMGSVMDDLRGSLYMRVFGNELRYTNFQGLDNIFANNINIMDLLTKLTKNNDFHYSHSSMIVDSSLMVPTYSGFPMNLTVNGVATMDMKASGKLDVTKLSSRPREMEIQGTIKPSAALEFTSTMSVDALVTKVGLKMVSSLFTSTAVQGKVSLADGSILDIEFDLPEDKMEILNVKSSFFSVHHNIEREQRMITENHQSSEACTGNKLAKISGLELCGQISYPNASLVENAPYFPLTGPVSTSLILHKRDTLTGYKLQARSVHTASENVIRMVFSTPKSKVDRTFGVDFNLNKKDGTMDISLDTPMKKANFAGNYQFSRKSAAISGKLNIDNSIRYEMKIGFEAAKSGPGMEYKPYCSIQVPGKTAVDLSGSIKHAPYKLFDADMTLSGIVKPPMKMQVFYMNKLKVVRLRASTLVGKKQEYSFDASCQKSIFKKKIIYSPQLSVRTPTEEVLTFGGSYTNMFGRLIKLTATLDKVFDKPIVIKKAIFGKKQFSRGRQLYNVNLDVKSSPISVQLKSKFDNRNMKTLGADIDVTYIIKRFARDNIKLETMIINQSTKSLTKFRLPMTFSSKRNPDNNFKLIMNADKNKKHSQIDAEFTHGPNLKDENKKISMKVSFDKILRGWSKAAIEFNGQFIKGNDLRLVSRIDHTHNQKELDTSVSLRFNKNVIMSTLSLKDQSTALKHLSGQFDLTIPGKKVSISQVINETKPSEFTSLMDVRIGKMRNTVSTSWKRPEPSVLNVNTQIDLHNTEKITLDGSYSFGLKTSKVAGSIEMGKDKYSISTETNIEKGTSIDILTDIECPSRRVILSFEQNKKDDHYISRGDLRWNVDRDDTQRLVVKSKSKMTSLNDIEGSLQIQYPTRKIALNMKHFAGKKYVSHMDIQWEPNKVYSIDTVFGNYGKNDVIEVEGNVKLSTPIKGLQKVDITVNHQTDASKVKSKLDVQLNPGNLISSTLTLKKPFSASHIDAEVVLKTPFKAFKTGKASLRHSAVINGISTVGKLNWNKQNIQMDMTLDDFSKGKQTQLEAELNLKTSLSQLRLAKFNGKYLFDGNTLKSSVSITKNKKSYGLTTLVNHNVNGWDIINNGNIKVSTPSNEFTGIWEYSKAINEITASATSTWGNDKRISVKYNGLQTFRQNFGRLSSALEVQSTLGYLEDVVVQIRHEHNPRQIDSSLKITSSGSTIASANGKYLNNNGQIKTSVSVSNPVTGRDMLLKLDSSYDAQPKTIHMEMYLSPQNSITMDGSYAIDSNTNIDSALTISVPSLDPFVLKATKTNTQGGVKSDVSMEYHGRKQISIHALHMTGNRKFVQLRVNAPGIKESSLNLEMKTTNSKREIMGSIEVMPLLPKWSLESSLDRSSGLHIKVNTPYPDLPYSQIKINSKKSGTDRVSAIVIEYRPGKEIKFLNTYDFDTMPGFKIMSSLETPFSTVPKVLLELSHQGRMNNYVSHGFIDIKNSGRFGIDTTLSTSNGIDSTIAIMLPSQETIRGSLRHTGSLNNFKTQGEITWQETSSFEITHTFDMNSLSTNAKITNGEDVMSANIDFNRDDSKATTSIAIQTPIKKWETLRFANTLEGKLNNFKVHSEISVPIYGTYSSDLNVDLLSTLRGEVAVQTPIKGYRMLRAVISITDSNEANLNVQIGTKSYSGNFKVSTSPTINVILSVKTPIQGYQFAQVSFTHEGSSINFKSNILARLNKNTHEVDISYDYIRKLNVDIAVKSSHFDDIKVSLDHWGKLSKFTSKLRARQGKMRISSDVQFQLKPSLNAQLSFKSPIPYLKNQQLTVKHAGTSNNFRCNMQYKCNGKSYIGGAAFENTDSLTGNANLKGTGIKPLSVSFEHKFGSKVMKSSAMATLGKKSINIDGNLDTRNGLEGKVNINTPFDKLRSAQAKVLISGSSSRFNTKGEISLNKQTASMQLSLDNTKDLALSADFNTPISGFESMSGSLKHINDQGDIETICQGNINGKVTDLRATFSNKESAVISGTLKSQLKMVSDIDVFLGIHKKTYSTRASLTIGPETYSIEAKFDKPQNGYSGQFRVIVPWVEKKTEAEYRLLIKEDSVNYDGKIVYGGEEKVGVVCDLVLTTPLSALVQVSTPFNGFEKTRLTLSHSFTGTDLRSEAILLFNKGKHVGKINMMIKPDIDGSIIVRSPMVQDIDVSASLYGTKTNFRSQGMVTYGGKQLFSSNTDINVEGPMTGTLKIMTPITSNVEASFSHRGSYSNIETNSQLSYGGENIFDVLVKGKLPKELELHIASPYLSQQPISIIIYLPMENAHAEISVNDLKHEVDFSLKFADPISVMFEVRSPLLTTMGMSLVSNSNYKNLKSEAKVMYGEKPVFELIANTDARNDIMGNIVLKLNDNEGQAMVTINNNDRVKKLDGHIKVSMNKHSIQGDMSLATMHNIEATVDVKTSFYDPLSATVTVSKSPKRYTYNAAFFKNADKHAFEFDIDTRDKLSTSVSFSSPYIKPTKVSAIIEGTIANFDANMELSYGRQKSFVKAILDIESINKGRLVFQSSISKPLKASYEFNGKLDNFNLASNIEYASLEVFDISANAASMPMQGTLKLRTQIPGFEATHHSFEVKAETIQGRMSARTSIASTLIKPVKSSVTINGHPTNFEASIDLSYGKQQWHVKSVLDIESPSKGKLEFQSPVTKPLKASYGFNGQLKNFDAVVGIEYGDENLFDFNARVQPDPFDGNVQIKTHFPGYKATSHSLNGKLDIQNSISGELAFTSSMIEPVKIGININGQVTNFDASMELAYGAQISDIKAILDVVSPNKGKIEFQSPITKPFKLSYEYNGKLSNLRSAANIEYDNENIISLSAQMQATPLQGGIQLTSQVPGYELVSFEFSHDVNSLTIKSHAELDISGSKTEFDLSFNAGSKLEGRVSAKSSYFASIEGGFSFIGNLKKFETTIDISFQNTKYGIEASSDITNGLKSSIKLETPFRGYRTISAKLQHEGTFPEIKSSAEVTTGRRNLANAGIELSSDNGLYGKAIISSILSPSIQFSLSQQKDNGRYKSEAEFRYNKLVSSFKTSFTLTPSIEGSYTLSLPMTASNGKFTLEEKRNGMNLKSDFNINSKSVGIEMEYHTGNGIGGSFELKTPFYGFEQIKGSTDLRETYGGFSANADLQMPQSQTYELKVLKNGMSGSIALKSPFRNFRYSTFDVKFEGQLPNINTEITLFFLNKKFSVEGNLDSSSGRWTVSTPFEPFKTSTLSFNKRGSLRDLQASIRLSAMNEEFLATIENKMDERKLETKARVSTPYTEDLSFELEHSGSIFNFYNSLVCSFGSDNSMMSTTTFRLEDSELDVDSALSTVLTGYANDQKVKVNIKHSLPSFSAQAGIKLFGSEFSLDSSLETERNIIGNLALKTPFKSVRNMLISFDHSGNTRRFETKATVGVNSEKISGQFSYLNYGMRRLQTSFDMKSTFRSYDNIKGSYRHSSDNNGFECDADVSVFNNDFSSSIRASESPLKAQITINTPFKGYQQMGADIKHDSANGIFNSEANVAFMQDNTISVTSNINMRNSPKTVNLAISTPFKGFEQSEIRLTHSGDIANFQSDAVISIPFVPSMNSRLTLRSTSLANFEATLLFNSKIENMENLKFNVLNEAVRGNYKSHIAASWAPAKEITINFEAADRISSVNVGLSVGTPFEAFRTFSVNSNTREVGKQLSNSLIIKHNEETCLDIDVSIVIMKSKPSVSINIREPVVMKAELSGIYDDRLYSGKFHMNNNFKVEVSHDKLTSKSAIEYQCPRNKIVFNSHLHPVNPNANLIYNNKQYGYDLSMAETKTLKVILPNRNLLISGSQENGKMEGKFMWDADRDDTKMVGLKSELIRRQGSVKADISVQMPSIGKDVQIDSEMVLNRGRLLFDGKTDLKYSKDSRKTLSLTSRLMDISNNWSTKNYSLSIGVNHPYSTVGVQLSSHVGKSNDQLTGGINLDYLTAQRETKQFSVNGEINKLRKSATFNMESPMKKISINGNTRLQSPFSVSLISHCDDKRPMKTVITLDPNSRKVDFQMNYDLENPSKELHISAKYVNNSALLGEITHVVNRQKITDALLSLRLNNSHLLHSRVHWRPSMISDMKSFLVKNGKSYKVRLAEFARVATTSVVNDVNMKSAIIQRQVSEELKPFIEMYRRNDYYVREITDVVVNYAIATKAQCTRVSAMTLEKMEEVAVNVQEMTIQAAKNIEIASAELMSSVTPKFTIMLEPLYNYTEHPLVRSARNQVSDYYTTYMDQVYALPKKLPSLADSYTSAIYNARDQLNSKLSSVLQRDDVKYVQSYTDPVVYQGKNAYKYWEMRENTLTIVDAIVDWIKSEVEEELSDLKATLFNMKETKFTVYDPAHGEIQVEIHLPVPLRSLNEIPVVDVAPVINKAKLYKNSLPIMPQISSDVSTWIPPFNAFANIRGDHVTTFDGFEYDLDGSCSFLLARDFVDGNFSLVLHRQENGKSLLIMADKKAITIQADGKVLIDNKAVDTPFNNKNIEVVSNKVETTVKGAGSFEVSYSPLTDLVTIQLNGWYYGKTGGLLGTYDNEPSNDLMSSYGRPINNPSRFARTWDMSTSKCR